MTHCIFSIVPVSHIGFPELEGEVSVVSTPMMTRFTKDGARNGDVKALVIKFMDGRRCRKHIFEDFDYEIA